MNAPPDPPAPPLTPDLKRALRQASCWAVMFGAGEASFNLLGAFLQAPASFFGLLAGIPQLLGPLAQVWAANLVDKTRRRKLLVIVAVLAQSVSFVPLVLLVFAGPGRLAQAAFLVVVTVYFVAGHFSAPPWTGLIGDLVPAEGRFEYFARQSRLVGTIGMVMQVAMGVGFYLGREYNALAWVFASGLALAGVARFGSFLCIQRMQEPPHESSPDTVFTFWKFIRRARESNFVHFVLFAALLHFGTQVAGPFFLPYWMYTLGYTEWEWVVQSSITAVAAILTMLGWGRFSQRFGNRNTMLYTGYGIALIPVGWMLTENLLLLGLINAASGVLWAGFGLSTWNYLLEAVSPPKRPRCTAYLNIIVGLGIFGGSMLGSWLAGCLPLTLAFAGWSVTVKTTFMYLLALSFFLRLSACLLMLPTVRELRGDVERFSLKTSFFVIAQSRVPFGIRFSMTHFIEKKPAVPDVVEQVSNTDGSE
ncbi:MAG: MFS transporter [Planctomycetota bacterium]|nr:MFS transporter [Planctomycetota bacterium]